MIFIRTRHQSPVVVNVRWLLVLLCWVSVGELTSQSPVDSTLQRVILDAAAVSAYSPLLSSEQIAATLWNPDSGLVNGFGSADFAPALNALPGVLMETRGVGGSRRLNVRGSALRSPFAVRNTMLFVRGFLLTEADGTSPIEWIEPSWAGHASLVSGAAATTFGGAYGGALVVSGSAPVRSAQGHAIAATTGSDGLQARLNVAVPLGNWEIRASRSQNSGYRDHEWNERWQLEAERNSVIEGSTHRDWLAFQDGSWALPGAIKLDDAPTLSPGEEYNAYVQRRRALWGHHIKLQNWRNKPHRRSLDVWSLVRWTDKVNPFGTSPFFNGYKEESGIGGSLRVRERFATWHRSNLNIQAEWNLMATYDDGDFGLWQSPIEQRQSEQLYDLQIRQFRGHWAPSIALAWTNGLRIESSAALSVRSRQAIGEALGQPYDAPFDVWSILPRLGLSKSIGQGTWFAQTSTGFSDPTNFESLSTDVQGAILSSLSPEQALTFETGYRISQSEIVVYHQTVSNAIVQIYDNEVETFVNQDAPLTMAGIEGSWRQKFPRHEIRLTGSFQWHVWETDNWLDVLVEPDRLPGSPAWTANAIHSWTFWQRAHQWSLNTWIRGVGETPLTSDGESVHPAYGVLNFQVNWNAANDKTTMSFGSRNVTNATYSSWHQLNGVYGKLYNPAPPRTLFMAVTWAL